MGVKEVPGPNPEWELNKDQNIAIAKRIKKSLLGNERPNRAVMFERMVKSGVENLEELNAIEKIEFLKEEGIVDAEGRPVAISREIQEELTNDDIEELTLGHTSLFSHIDNRYRTLVLGIGLCEEAKDSGFLIGSMIRGLPEDFTYPVYVIEQEPTLVSTKYGELPNGIVGANGLGYAVSDVYCFNLSGQGARIEGIWEVLDAISDIRGALSRTGVSEKLIRETLERLRPEIEEQERNLLHVDFIPEDGYRAMPLTSRNYERVNMMLVQIDVGQYKFE